MINRSQFLKASVAASLLPFAMDWHSLHLGEGIAVESVFLMFFFHSRISMSGL